MCVSEAQLIQALFYQRERVCVFLYWCVWISVCFLLLTVQTGTKWHQTPRHRTATHNNDMCVIPTSLSLSLLFFPLQMVLYFFSFLMSFFLHAYVLHLTLHFVFYLKTLIDIGRLCSTPKYLQCDFNKSLIQLTLIVSPNTRVCIAARYSSSVPLLSKKLDSHESLKHKKKTSNIFTVTMQHDAWVRRELWPNQICSSSESVLSHVTQVEHISVVI